MRLIDADAMKEMILKIMEKQDCKDNDLVPIKELQIFINNQPTAYDVDKVVEELKNADPQEMMSEEQRNVLNYAIEIVKQGGVTDDVCEWQSVRDGEFIQNPHTKRMFSNEPSMKNIYCNTCGKKIKVVE